MPVLHQGLLQQGLLQIATSPAHAPLHRFLDYVPIDTYRVLLPQASDYINATALQVGAWDMGRGDRCLAS